MSARHIGGRRFVQIRAGAFLKRVRRKIVQLIVCIFVYIVRCDWKAAVRHTTPARYRQRRPRRLWGVSLALLVLLACAPCVAATRPHGTRHMNDTVEYQIPREIRDAVPKRPSSYHPAYYETFRAFQRNITPCIL